ncbi:uncharacterized protein [Tursiops truncatus]|uniref:uncharacterized protein n=1 Tax=Tursiops truncatus TaxID=9739 RepID=UPI003CCFD9E2
MCPVPPPPPHARCSFRSQCWRKQSKKNPTRYKAWEASGVTYTTPHPDFSTVLPLRPQQTVTQRQIGVSTAPVLGARPLAVPSLGADGERPSLPPAAGQASSDRSQVPAAPAAAAERKARGRLPGAAPSGLSPTPTHPKQAPPRNTGMERPGGGGGGGGGDRDSGCSGGGNGGPSRRQSDWSREASSPVLVRRPGKPPEALLAGPPPPAACRPPPAARRPPLAASRPPPPPSARAAPGAHEEGECGAARSHVRENPRRGRLVEARARGLPAPGCVCVLPRDPGLHSVHDQAPSAARLPPARDS